MMIESEAVSGTCLVMEVATGKIKAIANLGALSDGSYWEDYNYALRTTEPGSTMKLATLLAVLNEGKIKANDMVEVGSNETAFVGVRNVTEAERMPKPVMSVRDCFAHSSNIGMSKLAYQTFAKTPDKYVGYLKKFHLHKRTGIDLMGEESPIILPIKRNKEGLHAMVTMSFGYAVEVSPLQTLMLYNSIANNGKMMKPYLLNSIQSNGQVIKEFVPEILEERIASEAVVEEVKQCMLAVTKEGTAKKIFSDALYDVAGKTGTAHVAGKDIRYEDGVYQASFAGFFPFEKPLYTCVVVIRTKKHPAKHFGGELAAPVFREVADKLMSANSIRWANKGNKRIAKDSTHFYYAGETESIKRIIHTLKLPYADSAKKSTWSTVYSNNDFRSVLQIRQNNKNIVPNVRGMGLRDALYLLESNRIKVLVKGKGKVVSQSIASGTVITEKMVILIELG
jgi:cell division protein FtsI (penicillin-binding protein 3)